MEKEIGVLMAISSLANEYSIGSLGRSAKDFIDFLCLNGITWWQILPLCLPDEFNSPYNSPSIYSINPFFIDVEQLYVEQLITYDELSNEKTVNKGLCNYKKLNESRYLLLYKAYSRNNESTAINQFMIDNPHINEFCKYQAIKKNDMHTKAIAGKYCANREMMYKFWAFTQYKAFEQLQFLINYAQQHNVKLMGDLPLYSSQNSSEFYFYPQYYRIDEDGKPLFLSGAVPDMFSSTGQCWGHPVYNWEEIRKENFKFWVDRFLHMSKLFDGIRLDHFRGFQSYLAIPAHSCNPLHGHFEPGPGEDLFVAAQEVLKGKTIVCEDLGVTTPKVQELVDKCGFYSMQVLQYGLDNNFQINLPVNYSNNCIAYTGTHDTPTLLGYINSLNKSTTAKLEEIFKSDSLSLLYDNIMDAMCKSNAYIVFFPIQDLLKTSDRYVLNTHVPSIENWCFRLNVQLSNKYLNIRRN